MQNLIVGGLLGWLFGGLAAYLSGAADGLGIVPKPRPSTFAIIVLSPYWAIRQLIIEISEL
jgi:hypothetical protein